MSIEIPQGLELQIEQVAQAQRISTDEALSLVIQVGLEHFASSAVNPRVSYAALFGAAKDGYGSREAVDRAIAEMRNEW